MLLAERFELQDPVGRGGMGEVWRARDERLGRTVAIKLLPDCAAEDPLAVTRFEREARIAARLQHPHVVGVYDFGVDGGRCFLVMEYVDGGTLADELRRSGPLPLDRFAALAGQTADGLAAAHRQGIVHRDVKPSNVLVDGEGLVKIADFGIARLYSTQTAAETTTAGQVRGTSMYVAPETALGRPTTSAADVYALGCSLYEMLTGRPPFQAETPLAVLWQHVERPLEPLAGLRPEAPADLRAYVEEMLAKDPAERPDAADVAARFDGGTWRGAPLPAGPAGLTVPPATSAAPAVPAFAAGFERTLADGALPSPAPPQRAGRRAGRGRRVLVGGVLAASAVAAAGIALATSSADGHVPPPGQAVTSPSAPGHKGAASPAPGARQHVTGPQDAAAPDPRQHTPAAGQASRPARPSAGGSHPSAGATTAPAGAPTAPRPSDGPGTPPPTGAGTTTPPPATTDPAPTPTPTSDAPSVTPSAPAAEAPPVS